MKLYKFGYLNWRDKFDVREIEVEEKDKCYVGESVRVLKSEIDKLTTYDSMYCLSSDPTTFINALVERTKKKFQFYLKSIENCKAELKKFDDWKKERK